MRMVHSKIFPCNQCSKQFPTVFHLISHKLVVHSNLNLCNLCGKSYKDLELHQKRIHTIDLISSKMSQRKTLFACTFCTLVFKTSSALCQHKVSKHEPKLTCSTCSNLFSRHHLRKHEKYCGSDRQVAFLCDICPKTYIHKTDLQRHKKCHSPPKLSDPLNNFFKL